MSAIRGHAAAVHPDGPGGVGTETGTDAQNAKNHPKGWSMQRKGTFAKGPGNQP